LGRARHSSAALTFCSGTGQSELRRVAGWLIASELFGHEKGAFTARCNTDWPV